MKKLLTLMLILSLVALAFAGPFKDVREDNRYYDYIVNLVDKGIIKANPGTEFKGTSPLTKEEAVVWMTKSVSYVENSPLIAKSVDVQDLKETMEKDVNSKLTNYDTKFTGYDTKIANYDSKFADLDSKINALAAKIAVAEKSLSGYNDRFDNIEKTIKYHSDLMGILMDRMAAVDAQSKENTANFAELVDKVMYIDEKAVSAQANIMVLKNKMEELSKTFDEKHQESVAALSEEIMVSKYFVLGKVDEVNARFDDVYLKLNELSTKAAEWKKYEATLKTVDTTYTEVKKSAFIGKNTADSVAEDMLSLVDDIDNLNAKIEELNTKAAEWKKYEATLKTVDTTYAEVKKSAFMGKNTADSVATDMLDLMDTMDENNEVANIRFEGLEEGVTINSYDIVEIKSKLGILNDLDTRLTALEAKASTDVAALGERVTALETKLPEVEKKIPDTTFLWVLSILGVGLGIVGVLTGIVIK